MTLRLICGYNIDLYYHFYNFIIATNNVNRDSQIIFTSQLYNIKCTIEYKVLSQLLYVYSSYKLISVYKVENIRL